MHSDLPPNREVWKNREMINFTVEALFQPDDQGQYLQC